VAVKAAVGPAARSVHKPPVTTGREGEDYSSVVVGVMGGFVLGDRFVSLLLRGVLSAVLESRLARALRIDAEQGKQPLEILRLARRT